MACVNPDGTLTESAQKILRAASEPITASDLSLMAGLPLFWVRSRIRSLVEIGLLAEHEGRRYQITEAGKTKFPAV